MMLIILTNVSVYAATPLETVLENRNGKQLIIKTFEVDTNENPGTLIENPFKLDGFLYSKFDMVKEEIPKDEKKTESEIITLETSDNDMSSVLKQLQAELDYGDDDGFTGKLLLDHTSIETEVKDYTTKTVSVTDKKTIGGLERNDPSSVPQTSSKNGVALKLSGIEWVVNERNAIDFNQLPASYTAIITYSGSYTQRVPTGYVTTATYTGEVSKHEVEKIICTITYLGEEIIIPTPEPVEQPEVINPSNEKNGWFFSCLITGLILLALAGACFGLMFYLRNVSVYLKKGDDYLFSAGRMVKAKYPIIDVSKIKANPGQEIAVLVKNQLAKHLFGRQITTVLHNGEEIKCLVDKQISDFWYVVTVPEDKATKKEIILEESI